MERGQRIKELREKSEHTQGELAVAIGSTKQTVYKYESGEVTNIPSDKVEKMAEFFHVSPAYIMGWTEDKEAEPAVENLSYIETRRFPLIGTIACGEPMAAEQHFEGYVEAGSDVQADFCLTAHGNSMVGARILDGDVVFIREQPDVENGEIAAVIIDNEATLKRVNKNVPGYLQLMPENPDYQPIVIDLSNQDESRNIRIIGKAVAFQSDVR